MARINRSFRKEMLRAFGITDALFELAHLPHADRPEFVVSKKTYIDAHRLVTEGVTAARSGLKPRNSQRKSTSFMLGFRSGVARQAAPPSSALPAPTKTEAAKSDDGFAGALNRGRPIPTYESPDAMDGKCVGLLTRDVRDRSTIRDLAERLLDVDEVQEQPGPEEHPKVAQLWSLIIAGWRLAYENDSPPMNAPLATHVGYEVAEEIAKRRRAS